MLAQLGIRPVVEDVLGRGLAIMRRTRRRAEAHGAQIWSGLLERQRVISAAADLVARHERDLKVPEASSRKETDAGFSAILGQRSNEAAPLSARSRLKISESQCAAVTHLYAFDHALWKTWCGRTELPAL